MSVNREIDIVIPWVDGGDPVWRLEKNRYLTGQECDDREERYRDWDNLQYIFRGIERFLPWVRKVHLITWGHLPKWLDASCEKLHIVNHRDYIPQQYLPTFSANPIELNIHRIEGLSEQFLYMNDDMYFLAPMKPEDFFRGGKPVDMLALQPVVANPANPVMSRIYLNNALLLARHFTKRENIRKQPGKYFHPGYPPMYFIYNLLELAFPQITGFYTVHDPSPFLKSTFYEVWEQEREALDETCRHKFRDPGDVSQYALREWQKLSGNFHAKNICRSFRYYNVDNSNRQLLDTIRKQKAKAICINDANIPIDFERVKAEINEAFMQILPEKSKFER